MGLALRVRVLVCAAISVAACDGTADSSYSLIVGSDDGGGGSFSGDASASGVLTATVVENHMTITIVRVSCAGECANVEAVASGGHPPYTFAWSDGRTGAARTVCPTSDRSYQVTVTDTATSGELARAAQTAEASLTAEVLDCPDGGGPTCDGGAPAGVAPGQYVGTVYCPPDGGVISLPSLDGGGSSGTVWIESRRQRTLPRRLSLLSLVRGRSHRVPDFARRLARLLGRRPPRDVGRCRVGSSRDGTGRGQDDHPDEPGHREITVGPVPGTPGAITGDFDFVNADGFCSGSYAAALQP